MNVQHDPALDEALNAVDRAHHCIKMAWPDRVGRLVRDVDVHGVSGEGEVADVWVWEGRPGLMAPAVTTIVVRWRGERSSTVVWDSLEDMLAVHGHDGRTRVQWAIQPGEGT